MTWCSASAQAWVRREPPDRRASRPPPAARSASNYPVHPDGKPPAPGRIPVPAAGHRPHRIRQDTAPGLRTTAVAPPCGASGGPRTRPRCPPGQSMPATPAGRLAAGKRRPSAPGATASDGNSRRRATGHRTFCQHGRNNPSLPHDLPGQVIETRGAQPAAIHAAGQRRKSSAVRALLRQRPGRPPPQRDAPGRRSWLVGQQLGVQGAPCQPYLRTGFG